MNLKRNLKVSGNGSFQRKEDIYVPHEYRITTDNT